MEDKNKISLEILDDISVRFLLHSLEFINLRPEEYFFQIEEAYWYVQDFYKIKDLSLPDFATILLSHNGISLNVISDHDFFKKYRQSVKVFGTIIFSKDFNHVLLVEQMGPAKNRTFPKGKKSKNEKGMDCAIRETFEEVGLDVRDKIVNLSVTVFEKMTFYCVFNVDMDYPFKTHTRNEISSIFWFNLKNVKLIKDDPIYKIFYHAYTAIEHKIEEIKNNLFKFDVDAILKAGCKNKIKK